jgi:hypothetical protein
MKNKMGAAVYADGTGSGGKEIGGLALLVPDAPTAGTVGGINRATWAFWRSQKFGALPMVAARRRRRTSFRT